MIIKVFEKEHLKDCLQKGVNASCEVTRRRHLLAHFVKICFTKKKAWRDPQNMLLNY